MSGGGAAGAALAAILAVLAVALVMALSRLVRGPSLPDRVVALDLIGYVAVGLLGVAAVSFDTPDLIQPAIVLAFVAFLGTVAYARYVERMGTDRRGREDRT